MVSRTPQAGRDSRVNGDRRIFILVTICASEKPPKISNSDFVPSVRGEEKESFYHLLSIQQAGEYPASPSLGLSLKTKIAFFLHGEGQGLC